MKKILMFLCCVIAMNVNVAFAVGDCPATFIQFSGTQKPNDNEFLYTTVKAQKSVVDGFVNSKSFNLSGGKVYECDNQQGCMNGSLIFLGDDSQHVFKGDVIKHKIMECSVGFEDRWITHEWTECPDSKINETYKIKFINTTDADCHAVGPYDYCCFTDDHKACLDAQKRGEPANWTQSGTCNCGDRHVWNPKTGHCEINNNKKPCGGIAHGKTKTENCPSSIPNGNQCSRTCNDGNWSEWKLVSCKTEYKIQGNICVKVTTQSPNPNQNTAPQPTPVQPVPNPSPIVVQPQPQQYECPEPVNGYLYWRAQYKDCEDVIAGLNELEEYCKSGDRTKPGYESRIAGLEKLRDQCKEEAARNQRITRSTAIINNAEQKLKEIETELKSNVSVWKTAEGNFNTARLASDSVAGVVLGTAGGLITSHLVKKGQVKNGFEDIQCTVGGQKVADWGDEFTVGIR